METTEIRGSEDRELTRLPEAELEAMLAVWRCEPPVTTARVMLLVDPGRSWKTPTLISFLTRLEKRGFLTAEKHGREYVWVPAVERDRYLSFLTRDFLERVHGGSLPAFLSAAAGEGPLSDETIDGLLSWLESRS